jgi:hypothetical protein
MDDTTMTYARKKNMTTWMKNFGLSLKLRPTTNLLLDNTRINFQFVYAQ